MRTLSTDTLKMWRWIFITAQTAVFVTFSLALILEFVFGIIFEPPTAFIACYVAALFFLLIASPFFFKTLGKLALIGWFVTLAIFVLSLCIPVRAGHL